MPLDPRKVTLRLSTVSTIDSVIVTSTAPARARMRQL